MRSATGSPRFADDKLDATQRFQRDYVLAVIDGQLFWLEDSGFAHNNPGFYTGDLSPSMYLTRPYAPLPQRMAAFVTYQEALPKAIAQIQANFKAPLPATYIDLGVNTFGGYASFFQSDVPEIFAEVKDDALQARFKASNAAAIKATQEMADWFTAQKPQGDPGLRAGRGEVREDAARDRTASTCRSTSSRPIGEADLARNLASLKSACDQFAPGQTLHALRRQGQRRQAQGGAVEGARAQLDGLRQFIVDKDLVTIPGTEQAKVDEAPPFNRWNFAYIEIPGPTRRTCRRCTTSRRRIRNGRRPNRSLRAGQGGAAVHLGA